MIFMDYRAANAEQLVEIVDEVYSQFVAGQLNGAEATALAILAQVRLEAMERARFDANNPAIRHLDDQPEVA